jgi:hypothetical protein
LAPADPPRLQGGDDEDDWLTDGPFCYGDLCSVDRLVIDAKTSRPCGKSTAHKARAVEGWMLRMISDYARPYIEWKR